MIMKNINCIYNDESAWCTNKNVKRSLFGIGVRCCRAYDGETCEHQEESCGRPLVPPPAPSLKKRNKTKTTKSKKRRRMFRDEDMKHIVIDGVGGLHFDPEYFLELPRFKKVVEEGSKAMEEEK